MQWSLFNVLNLFYRLSAIAPFLGILNLEKSFYSLKNTALSVLDLFIQSTVYHHRSWSEATISASFHMKLSAMPVEKIKRDWKTYEEKDQDMHWSDNALVQLFFDVSIESSENSYNPFEHTEHALKEQIQNVCIPNVLW